MGETAPKYALFAGELYVYVKTVNPAVAADGERIVLCRAEGAPAMPKNATSSKADGFPRRRNLPRARANLASSPLKVPPRKSSRSTARSFAVGRKCTRMVIVSATTVSATYQHAQTNGGVASARAHRDRRSGAPIASSKRFCPLTTGLSSGISRAKMSA